MFPVILQYYNFLNITYYVRQLHPIALKSMKKIDMYVQEPDIFHIHIL